MTTDDRNTLSSSRRPHLEDEMHLLDRDGNIAKRSPRGRDRPGQVAHPLPDLELDLDTLVSVGQLKSFLADFQQSLAAQVRSMMVESSQPQLKQFNDTY